MRTIEELVLLTAETLDLWLRSIARLGTWFLIGWTVFTLGQHASVQLGGGHKLEATLVFVLGIIAQVLSTIMMIHTLEPSLRTPQRLASSGTPVEQLPLPASLFRSESRSEVALATIGPFLGVYAVWGLVDQWVRDLFFINQAVLGEGNTEQWSVSFADASTLYLVLAGVALVLRWVLGRIARRHRVPWLVLPLLFLEGLWVFASFFVFLQWAQDAATWFNRRVLAGWLADAWEWFVGLLPDLHLPFGWHLPALMTQMGRWLWSTFWPATWQSVLLPLMWLALAATVFGWREFSVRGTVSGTRVESVASRLELRRAPSSVAGSTQRALGTIAELATADLRDKWIPIGQSLRLVWRSGPRFLAAYLVLATLVKVGSYWVAWLLQMIVGPQPFATVMLWFPLVDLLSSFFEQTLSVALYVAAFDRAIADVSGVGWRQRRVRRLLGTEATQPLRPARGWPAPSGEPVVAAWPAPVDAPLYPSRR